MYEDLFATAGLSLERLKTFRDIVEAGGITAASEDDANRQSQFSRQLKELERYFGVELLKRGHGPIELTDAGRRLYEVTERTFAALEEFRSACLGRPATVTVGAGESLIQWLLLPNLSELAARCPKTSFVLVNLKTTDILRRLADSSLDFGLVSRGGKQRGLETRPIAKLEYRLFVPSELADRGVESAPILHRLPLALLEGSSEVRSVVLREAAAQGATLDIRLRLTSYPQLVQAVRVGRIAGVMPTLARPALVGSNVEEISLPLLSSIVRPVSLAWNRRTAELRPSLVSLGHILEQTLRPRP